MDDDKSITALFLNSDSSPLVDIWYGNYQRFGHLGDSQRWINILGKVVDPDGIASLTYSLNGGAEQRIDGGFGSIVLTEDGNDILLEFWAVDWVNNVETPKNQYMIDIDQTVPFISLTYEVIGGNNLTGWIFEFTANAVDDMSGMDYVEFYLNNILQENISGTGPEYTWTIKYNPLPRAIFRATAYDKAGLYNSDEIVDPTKNTHNSPSNYNIFYIIRNTFEMFFLKILEKFPIIKTIIYEIGGI